MKKVVVIGGGAGLSTLLRGLKHIDGIDISAIVTVADDGGSTGQLRKELSLPAMGDIRRVIAALSENRPMLEQLLEYRFSKDAESTSGHSLGNLIIAAMSDIKGSFEDGIEHLSEILNIKGKVIPVSSQNINITAHFSDGTIIKGEHAIPSHHGKIETIVYDEKVKASNHAVQAIKEADAIIFSMGSLYTSIIANIAIPSIKKALASNKKARKIYVSNIVTQPGETTGYSIEDHVNAINKHVGVKDYIDTVVKTKKPTNEKLIAKYEKSGQRIVVRDTIGELPYIIIVKDMLDATNKDHIRHDVNKITNAFKSILKNM